jgi:biotin-dependent carboxylase-like uncharacterized protein
MSVHVERVLGLVTVQDAGRDGWRHAGVPVGGALDQGSLQLANALVGNAPGAAALEGCLASLTLRFDVPTTLALAGAVVEATLDGRPLGSGVVDTADAGSTLQIARITQGAVWYLALRGGVDVPSLLGGRGSLIDAGLGPPPLRRGDTLRTADDARDPVRAGPIPATLRTPLDDAPIAWLPGTRLDALEARGWQQFFGSTWTLSRLRDRSGYRLDGAALPVGTSGDRASEPTCLGAMQLPPDGRPIVLLAEAPTIGGYPVIGVVPRPALDAFVQRAPGSTVTFVPSTVDEVHAEQRARAAAFTAWCAQR